jgi:DNA-binding transcriptional regulator YiaG
LADHNKAPFPIERLRAVAHLSLTDAAAALGVSRTTIKRWRRAQKTHSSAA